jgi:hypothetical protein
MRRRHNDPSRKEVSAVAHDDATAARMYRLAQAARLVRYCAEQGVDFADVSAGRVQPDLAPILDDDGKIVPEGVDILAVTTRYS